MKIKLLKPFYENGVNGGHAVMYDAGFILENVHDTGLGFYEYLVDVIGWTIKIPVEDAAIIL